MQPRTELRASAVQREGRTGEGAVQQEKCLFTLKMGDHAATGRANKETGCCFSSPTPAPVNPPHRKDKAEVQKKSIIFSSALTSFEVLDRFSPPGGDHP